MNLIQSYAGVITVGLALAIAPSIHAGEPQIHPDCVNNRAPLLCTEIVDQLLGELNNFNDAFKVPNAEEAAKFYHEQAIVYTKATDAFYIGRDQILNNYFVPLVSIIRTAHVDVQFLHFQVIDPDKVIVYGRPTASLTLKDGTMLLQPPLPQTLTFIRNFGYDPKRPFVIVADQE